MDKFERRRLRLKELIDTKCDSVNAKLARKIGRDPSYVNRMLYPAGKAGKKRIADDMIEIIQDAFDLPHGWLDANPGEEMLNIDMSDKELVALIKTVMQLPKKDRPYAKRSLDVVVELSAKEENKKEMEKEEEKRESNQ